MGLSLYNISRVEDNSTFLNMMNEFIYDFSHRCRIKLMNSFFDIETRGRNQISLLRYFNDKKQNGELEYIKSLNFTKTTVRINIDIEFIDDIKKYGYDFAYQIRYGV